MFNVFESHLIQFLYKFAKKKNLIPTRKFKEIMQENIYDAVPELHSLMIQFEFQFSH